MCNSVCATLGMSTRHTRLVAVCLVYLSCFAHAGGTAWLSSAHAQPMQASGAGPAVPPMGTRAVIVNLRAKGQGPTAARGIADAQEAVLAAVPSGFYLSRRYKHVAALAGWVTEDAAQQLRAHPQVTLVQKDHHGGGQLLETLPAVGADIVRSTLGLTGQGVRVAMLDTGIDEDHPDLRDALVAQHCFTQFACPPFGLSEGTGADDDNGHGSHVAGIVASKGFVSGEGLAPDVELVSIKINDSQDRGRESDWLAGLDWLYDNLPRKASSSSI